MAGDCRRGARGSDHPRPRSWIDSVAEVDERREATRVLCRASRHRAEGGLAPTCASIGERTSVGSWIAAAKPRDQWRVRASHRASGDYAHGHSSMEAILGRAMPRSFERGRGYLGLGSCRSACPAGKGDEDGRGICDSTMHAVDNAAAWERCPEQCSCVLVNTRMHRESQIRSSLRVVKRASTWGRSLERRMRRRWRTV